MISLFKNAKYISQLNIHYYPNRRYKPYVIFLRAVIVGKTLISAGLDIDRILHFIFYDKILQISGQHWVRRFYRRHTLSKYRQISKKWGDGGGCYNLHNPGRHTLVYNLKRNSLQLLFYCGHFCRNKISFRVVKYNVSTTRNEII